MRPTCDFGALSNGQAQTSEEAKRTFVKHYTNADGDMFCQGATRHSLLRSEGAVFEAIQFVGNRNRTHRQNTLALCPLCAAKYRYKRETSDDALMTELGGVDVESGQGTVDVPVLLNGRVSRLRFTGKHAIDLQTALEVAGEARA